MIEALKLLIKQGEGLKLKPYRDSVGKLTIGVGRNLEDCGISEKEADFLLDSDVQKCLAQAQSFPFFESLSDARKMVVVSMIFNLGISGFMRFEKMITYIKRQDFEAASNEMLESKWAAQLGNRAIMLIRMMKYGNILS